MNISSAPGFQFWRRYRRAGAALALLAMFWLQANAAMLGCIGVSAGEATDQLAGISGIAALAVDYTSGELSGQAIASDCCPPCASAGPVASQSVCKAQCDSADIPSGQLKWAFVPGLPVTQLVHWAAPVRPPVVVTYRERPRSNAQPVYLSSARIRV